MSETKNQPAILAGVAQLADHLLGSGPPPTGRPPRFLTPVYGSLRRSFSGTTWYFARAALGQNVIDGAFSLNPEGSFNPQLQATGAAWKAWRTLTGRQSGGFKFAAEFHDILWNQTIDRFRGATIINNTQVFGDAFLRKYQKLYIKPCFYIDGTLTEYFYGYGQVERQTIGPDMVKRAIEMEREGYQHASRIITMSQSSVRNLVDVYDVPADKITMVMPGANIDDADAPPPPDKEGWFGDEFTLGFVGLFPVRKGLEKLAKAVAILRGQGAPIRLRVIGRCPDEIAAMDGVDFLGTISKATETARFIEAIRSVDLGCQLSQAELLGIAMLEFIRVGVPVMATAVGGMPDVLASGGGVLVDPAISPEALAQELLALMNDTARYRSLRAEARARSNWASWTRAAHEIDAALAGVA